MLHKNLIGHWVGPLFVWIVVISSAAAVLLEGMRQRMKVSDNKQYAKEQKYAAEKKGNTIITHDITWGMRWWYTSKIEFLRWNKMFYGSCY